MSTPEIIPWPEKADFTNVPTWTDFGGNPVEADPYFDETNYERQRAEAALSRLRVAVEALAVVGDWSPHKSFGEREAAKTLASIGELPGEKT